MSNYVDRLISSVIKEVAQYYPVIVITGPRQSGKTSLCRHLYSDYKYINLEDITNRAAALSDPAKFVNMLGDKVIIDEVQHVPELLSMIQVRVDEDKTLRYILTGSSNFSLLSSITQSLAGRAAMFTLLPFSFKEMSSEELDVPIEKLLWQGQYPGVLADGIPPHIFFSNYYTTYVERDLRDLLKIKNIGLFDTFIRLVAARVGSEFNASSIAREVGVSSTTVSEWMSLLSTSYIAFSLRPYFQNVGKRLTKMPKIYFYDTGVLCYLLRIQSFGQLMEHSLRGAVFENMAVVELLKNQYNQALAPDLYFYREYSGREADVVLVTPEGLNLYESKAGKTLRPGYASKMTDVSEALGNVNESLVIYDGETLPGIAVNIRDI